MFRHRCLASGIGGLTLIAVWFAFFRTSDKEAVAWQESHSLLGDGQAISALAFSGNGQRLAAGDFAGNLFLWELPSGRCVAGFEAHGTRIRSLAFSPDGQTLATTGSDNAVKLWSLAGRQTSEFNPGTLEEIQTLVGHQACVVAMRFAPDGLTLITGDGDGVVKLWDTATGRERASWLAHQHERGITSLACSPNGQMLATAGLDRWVKLWDLASGRDLVSFSEPNPIHNLTFSGDGKSLITANHEGTIQFWNIASHQTTETLSVAGRVIVSLAVTTDGRKLFSASLDGTMSLWNLDAGRTPVKLDLGNQLLRAVAFSPTGDQFAFAAAPSEGEIALLHRRDFAVKIWQPLSP